VILQTDPGWVAARVGKLTASRMKDARDFVKDGKPTKADPVQKWRPGSNRIKLLHELVAERACGSAMDHYVTPAMQWGLDNEPEAVARFEEVSGEICLPGGLLDHPTIEWFAATPDRRLADGESLLEVKCPTTTKFVAWKAAGIVPEEHRDQMLAQLACFRRKRVIFAAFDPRITMRDHQLFVRVFEPTLEEIQECEHDAREFLREVDILFNAFVTKEAA
jgi:hypothetical protein